jgi:hypothetical protein
MLLYLLVAILSKFVNSRHVYIDVKSPWPRYELSLIADISEYFAEHSTELFWKYVDNVCFAQQDLSNVEKDSDSSDDRLIDIQTIAFNAASSILPRSFTSMMETMVSLGAYYPTVNFFETLGIQYGNPCSDQSFIVLMPSTASGISQQIFCSFDELRNFIISLQSLKIDDIDLEQIKTGSEWDHVYSPPDNAIEGASLNQLQQLQHHLSLSIALYGALGTMSFCQMYHELKLNSLTFSFRHSFHGMPPIAKERKLQGYGVFLDIKNMEYKNIDEVKADESKQHAAGEDDVSSVIIQCNNYRILPSFIDSTHSLYAYVLRLNHSGRDITIRDEYVVTTCTIKW